MKQKKLIRIFITAILVLAVSGCNSSNQSNATIAGKQDSAGNNIVFTLKDNEIIADDFFEILKNEPNAGAILFNLLEDEILNTLFPPTDVMWRSAELYLDQLKAQYNSMYGADGEKVLLQELASQRNVYSFEEFKEEIIYYFQVTEYIEKFLDEHFETVFEKFFNVDKPRRISHILVSMEDSENPTDEEMERVEEIHQLLDDGEDFATIAKEHSDCGSASDGGDLGLLTVANDSNFVEEFLEASLKLEEGEVVYRVKTQFGYHFIKATAASLETMIEDEEYTETIRNHNIITFFAFREINIEFANETLKEKVNTYVDNSISSVLGGE